MSGIVFMGRSVDVSVFGLVCTLRLVAKSLLQSVKTVSHRLISRTLAVFEHINRPI